MISRRGLNRVLLSASMAVAALMATASIAFAYPPPEDEGDEEQGCTSMDQGGNNVDKDGKKQVDRSHGDHDRHCDFKFKFRDHDGKPKAGAAVTFKVDFVDGRGQPVSGGVGSVHGLAASVLSPLASASITPRGITDANGIVAATLTVNSGSGNAVITATEGAAAVRASVVVVGASPAAPLPASGTEPPGTNPLAYLGIALALLVLLGGAITLRQTRRTA